MGRTRRRNTPQRAVKRAKEQDYRDRRRRHRRRAALEREQHRELAEELRPVDAAGAGARRRARAADGWRRREHLNAEGVEFADQLAERTFDAVCRTHAGGVPWSSSSAAASVVSEMMAA